MVFRKFIVKYEWVINMNLVDLLNDSKQFNETQNIICQYILNHSEDVVKMSARALAKRNLYKCLNDYPVCAKDWI